VIARSLGRRLAASAAVVAAVALTVSACTFITPQATRMQYDPADGVGANLGDIVVRDVIAVTDEDAEVINLAFTAVNRGTQRAQLNMSFRTADGVVKEAIGIPAGGSVRVGGADTNVEILIEDPEGATLGGLYEVYFQAGAAEGVPLLVPVLDDEARPYLTPLMPTPQA